MDLSYHSFSLEYVRFGAPPVGIGQFDFSDLQIWHKVCCYALWPKDEEARRAAAASFWAEVSDNDLQPPQERPVGWRQAWQTVADCVSGCLWESFTLAGGGAALHPAVHRGIISKKERERANDRLNLAGDILAVIKAISDSGAKGSLNKAVFVIDEAGRARRTSLMNAWKSHKGVAHLQIAERAVAQLKLSDPETEMKAMLAIARDLQDFALNGGHVPANELWTVPNDFPDLPAVEPVHPCLTAAMRCALARYHAPQS